MDRDISLSKRELIQQKENNQTDSISRSGETCFTMCSYVCMTQGGENFFCLILTKIEKHPHLGEVLSWTVTGLDLSLGLDIHAVMNV